MVKLGNDFYKIKVTICDSVSVDNIVLQREKINKRWLLQLRSDYDIEIKRQNGGDNLLNEDEYIKILDTLIHHINHDGNIDGKIAMTQLDLNLVNPTWASIVSSVHSLVAEKSGVVKYKDKEVFDVVLNDLLDSKLLARTCSLVKKYNYICDATMIGMNPIAFREDILGKNWMFLSTLSDAGMEPGIWFSVRFDSK